MYSKMTYHGVTNLRAAFFTFSIPIIQQMLLISFTCLLFFGLVVNQVQAQ